MNINGYNTQKCEILTQQGGIQREYSEENPARDDNYVCQVGMRNDCTVGKLSERNEAGDEEAICRRNRSCVSSVRVAQP